MGEPVATVPRRDPISRSPRDAHEVGACSWRVLADVLLLKSPAWLDGVEVVRVRRQVEQANAEVLAPRFHARVVVGLQVVEHENVAALQPRQQRVNEPGDEAVLVRCGEHGAHQHPVSRIAPSRVRFFPQFIGVRSTNSWPLFTQAWLLVIDAFRPDSSMKTSRSGGTHESLERFSLQHDVRAQLLERSQSFFSPRTQPDTGLA